MKLYVNTDVNHLSYLELTDGKINRKIILKNHTDFEIVKKIHKYTKKDTNLFNPNELIMAKKQICDVSIKNKNGQHVFSIKELLLNYSDKSKYFTDNTLKNILDVENISLKIDSTDHISVCYLNFIKKTEICYDIETALNMHVSLFFVC